MDSFFCGNTSRDVRAGRRHLRADARVYTCIISNLLRDLFDAATEYDFYCVLLYIFTYSVCLSVFVCLCMGHVAWFK